MRSHHSKFFEKGLFKDFSYSRIARCPHTKVNGYKITKLTTASLSGGWMPETSRSFHYWQPAPRWRLLQWLANPRNPAMSPHSGKGNRHPSVESSGKREGRGGKNYLNDELAFHTTPQVHAQSTHTNASNEEHTEFRHIRICKNR